MTHRYGVIDIGTNSTRLMLAETDQTQKIRVKDKKLITTRIGEGINDQNLTITPEAMQRTIRALANFLAACEQEEVDRVYAYATSAVRSATNQAEFLEACRAQIGLSIDVVSGEMEALINFLGVLGPAGTGRVIDIGGGSTECITGQNGTIMLSGSMDMGAVRAAKMLPDTEEGYALVGKLLYESPMVMDERKKNGQTIHTEGKKVKAFLHRFRKIQTPVYAVGGTATTIAALASGLHRSYDARVVQGRSLTRDEIERVFHDIGSLSLEQRKAIPILYGREDIICFGAALLYFLFDELDITNVICSEHDNLDGYLRYQLQQNHA